MGNLLEPKSNNSLHNLLYTLKEILAPSIWLLAQQNVRNTKGVQNQYLVRVRRKGKEKLGSKVPGFSVRALKSEFIKKV